MEEQLYICEKAGECPYVACENIKPHKHTHWCDSFMCSIQDSFLKYIPVPVPSKDEKLCPLLKMSGQPGSCACIKERCAWWHDSRSSCAWLSMTEALCNGR